MKATIIRIIDDQVREDAETIEIALSRPQNGTLGYPSAGEVVIKDDDVVLEITTPATPSRPQLQLGINYLDEYLIYEGNSYFQN